MSFLAINDVIKVYEKVLPGVSFRDRRALPVAIFFTKIIDPSGDLWIREDMYPYALARESYQTFKDQFSIDYDQDKFLLVELLRDAQVPKELVKTYSCCLFSLAFCLANTVEVEEDETQAKVIKQIEQVTKAYFVKDKDKRKKNDPTEQLTEQQLLDELNGLVGLRSVKTEIQSIINLVKMQNAREREGLKTIPVTYHCVFTGNPGTGKTTVARIVAQIYKSLGILKGGHLVETDRSGLVAEYVGQTAVKTNKIVDSALDGVLFIDEAYSLATGSSNDYGPEAIATLLKRMEDDRDRLIVILAGYTDEMKNFIDTNPGLQSRFTRYIEFDDYTPDELERIFDANLKKYDFGITDSARAQLKTILRQAYADKDRNFGNARFVRNLFEKTIRNQASRLSHHPALSKESLSTIEEADISLK